MAGAPNRLIHELVEQSRDRVAHVRAGQSLLDVLDAQLDVAGLPAAAALVRKPDARVPAPPATMRKRAAVGGVASPSSQASSYEQYAVYAGSKLLPSDSLTMLDRRKAIATSSTQLARLAAVVNETEAAARETAAGKLKRAVAVMKTQHAFLHLTLSRRSRTATPVAAAKNTHMAFLEFQATGSRLPPVAAAADAAVMNAASHEPLRFGDAVCLLSLVSNLPLAVGRNGRAASVRDAVTGPHMVFTVVDFRDPSRRDDVLYGEDFWLRVDASQLELGEPDEILALLVDTHYYLGGPGSIEDAGDGDAASLVAAPSVARKYLKPHGDGDDAQLFKVVAMKASVPSAEYYGDDRATREYAEETNPSVVRLAKWRFAPATTTTATAVARPRRPRGRADANELLVLNCASVALHQGEFALEYDAVRRRGVLRGSLRPVHDHDSETAHYHRGRDAAAWQVRLMHRGHDARHETAAATTTKASASALGDASPSRQRHHLRHHRQSQQPRVPTAKESLEWLQFHSDKLERDAQRIRDKSVLAREAHRAYDKVAAQSNAKLVQIEHHKALHHREYFQSKFREVFDERHKHDHDDRTRALVLPRL